MITDMKFDLQHFADAGTLVNATGNFVNAGTGATTAFDGTHSLSAELKAFYDTELLENARTELFYAQPSPCPPTTTAASSGASGTPSTGPPGSPRASSPRVRSSASPP